MDNNFTKKFNRIICLLLAIILLLPMNAIAANNIFAIQNDEIAVRSNSNSQGMDVEVDFKNLYRLNETEVFDAYILDGDKTAVINGTTVGIEPVKISINTLDNRFNFTVSSSTEEDFLLALENSRFKVVLNLNTLSGNANLLEIVTDMVAGDLDYAEVKSNSLYDFSGIYVEGGAQIHNPQSAMTEILTSDFNFNSADDVNADSIKAQVDEKLAGSNLNTEVKYDNNLKYYTLTISDGADSITKPLYINSEVSNIFVMKNLLDYTEGRKTDSTKIGIDNNTLKVSATESNGYSNIILPIWNFGRNFTIEADMIHNGGVNDARWIGLGYGTREISDNVFSFWHMAMRKKTTANNGVEIARRTEDDKWDVTDANRYDENFKDNKFYNVKVVVEDGEVREYINNELVLKGPSREALKPDGRVAITYDRANFEVRNLKVTSEIPSLPRDYGIEENNYVSDIYIPNTKISVSPAVVSNNESIEKISNDSKRPATVLFELNDNGAVVNNGNNLTISQAINGLNKKAIPGFYVDTVSKADKLLRYIEDNKLVDVFVVSKNEEILKKFSYGQNGYKSRVAVYTVLDLSDENISNNLIDAVYRTNKTNSRIVLLNEEDATFENIKYIQSRAVVTWVKSSGDTEKLYNNILSGTYGIVVDNFTDAIEAIESFNEDGSDAVLTRVPVVAAHRAMHYENGRDLPELNVKSGQKLPENSVIAAQAAIKYGADALELDIHMASDGVLVVNHDFDTNRLSTENYEVNKTSSEILTKVPYKQLESETICTLKDYINKTKDMNKDVVYVIEIKGKDATIIPALKNLLEETGVKDRAVLITFVEDLIPLCRMILPELSIANLNPKVSAIDGTARAMRRLTESLDPDNAFYNMHYSVQNYNQLQNAIPRGILFHPWTVNDNNLFQDEYLKGYHGITSNTFYQAEDFLTKVSSSEDNKITSEYRNGNSETKDPVINKNVKAEEKDLNLAADVYTLPNTGKKYAMYTLLNAKPKAEEKVTFGVISDTHLRDDNLTTKERTQESLEYFREYGTDASFIVGDVTDNSKQSEYNHVKEVLDAQKAKGQRIITSMGNHDFYGDEKGYEDRFKATTDDEPNSHNVINGYHFIMISPSNSRGNGYTTKTLNYLSEELAKAKADTGDKPIFVFFHHPIKDTFYVSEEWNGSIPKSIFKDYPMAVTFSGHIHSPNNHPRSIWQGNLEMGDNEVFTAVNTVTQYYFEMESGYGNGSYPEENGRAHQGLIVEADGTKVTIKNRDFYYDKWIDQTWTFDTANPENFPYTDKRYAQSVAPEFPADTKFEVTPDKKTVEVEIGQAKVSENSVEGDIVHSYEIEVSKEGKPNFTKKEWSNFHLMPMPETRKFTLNDLEPGTEYKLDIYPVNAFKKRGEPITKTFKTLGEKGEKIELKELFNVDFRERPDGAEKYGHKKSVLGQPQERDGSMYFDGVKDAIKYDTNREMYNDMNRDGFTFEFMYKPYDLGKNNNPIGNLQGSGIGLEQEEGTNNLELWASIGGNYVKPLPVAEIENEKWVHITVTYNKNDLKLYKDGELVEARSQRGDLKVPPYALYLGNDTRSDGSPENMWSNSEIRLAKIYSGVMDDNEVKESYLENSKYEKPEDPKPEYEIELGAVLEYDKDLDKNVLKLNVKNLKSDNKLRVSEMVNGVYKDPITMDPGKSTILVSDRAEKVKIEVVDADNNVITEKEFEVNKLKADATVIPKPIDPKPVDPRPVDPKPVDPKPVDPRPSRPSSNDDDYYNPKFIGFFGYGDTTTSPINPVTPSTITKPVITDIAGHWGENPITTVVNKGYMDLENGKFYPNRDATRLEFVRAMARMAGANPNDYMNKKVFDDVVAGTKDAGYINWAYEKGIVKGTDEGKFEGAREISRQEIATILNRYTKEMNVKLDKKEVEKFADDEKIADWAKADVLEARAKGIFSGKDNNMFDPMANITRAEVAQVIVNMDK